MFDMADVSQSCLNLSVLVCWGEPRKLKSTALLHCALCYQSHLVVIVMMVLMMQLLL